MCKQVREKMLQELKINSAVIGGAGPVRSGPIGPHPVPMFEAWFQPEVLHVVLEWIYYNRQGLSVLIHPLSENELKDHTERALWLGEKQPLDLSILNDGPAH